MQMTEPKGSERTDAEIKRLLQGWVEDALAGEAADDILVEVLGAADDIELADTGYIRLALMGLSRILALQLDAGGAVVESATVDEVADLIERHVAMSNGLLEWIGSLCVLVLQLRDVLPSGDDTKAVRQMALGMYHNAAQYVQTEVAKSGLGLDPDRFERALDRSGGVSLDEDLGRS